MECVMHEVKTEEVFDLSSYSAKYYDDTSRLVVSKMKDETNSAAIGEFVGLKPNIICF